MKIFFRATLLATLLVVSGLAQADWSTNLGAAFGPFSVDVAVGEYDNFDGPTLDYTFYSITAEKNGFYGKLGGFSRDFEGEYFEAGYGMSVADIDVGLSLIFSNSDLVGESDQAVVFTVGKSFDLQ